MSISHALRSLLRRTGYDVCRYAPPVEKPFPVLPLVVDHLVRSGQSCFFVQVGANDGVRSDPLRAVILRHSLPGILVEPVPDLFDKLVANYGTHPGLRFEQAAVAEADGVRPFFRVRRDAPVPDHYHGLGSFDRTHLRKFGIPDPDRNAEEITVPCLTLGSLLKKHGATRIDLLQVDIEGYDDQVVTRAVTGGIFPRIINYENAHVPFYQKAVCRRVLLDAGYRFLDVGMDTLAVREDDAWRLPN